MSWHTDPYSERVDVHDWTLAELRCEFGNVTAWEPIIDDEWMSEELGVQLLRQPDEGAAVQAVVEAALDRVLTAYTERVQCRHQLALPLQVAA